MPLVDEVAPAVAAIGALNTVLIRDGRTVGHNTDVTGFLGRSARGCPDADLDRVVLLGAGGAGTAVAHALAELGVGRLLVVVDPDRDRAQASRPRLSGRLDGRSSSSPRTRDGLAAAVADQRGPGQRHPGRHGRPPGAARAARSCCDADLWVADIVYRPLRHRPADRAPGAPAADRLSGAGMAVHQAADAFELITGRPADRAAMFRDFDELVAAESRTRRPTRPRLGNPPEKGTDDGTLNQPTRTRRGTRVRSVSPRPGAALPPAAATTQRGRRGVRRRWRRRDLSSPTATPRTSRSTAAERR